MKKISVRLKENQGFLAFIALMIVMRAGVADWYQIPSGSMKPTIVEGDRILVNKLAYSVRIPFTDIQLKETGNPARGDVVVFNSKAANERLIKRVVALPGDKISMVDNGLTLNGNALQYQPALSRNYIEDLPGRPHKIQLKGQPTKLANFPEVTVPDGHVLVLGDNRNNSADSRVHGFVPMEEIVGRANVVLYSLDYENYYLPRMKRTLAPLS